jgi:hypothetical protein
MTAHGDATAAVGADLAEATAKPRINRLAIGSFVASAVSLLGIGSLVGIALGVVALNQLKVRGEGAGGLRSPASRSVRSHCWSA